MPEQLDKTFCDFGYDINDQASLEKSYNEVKGLTEETVSKISIGLKQKYIKNYSFKELAEKYRKSINKLLNVN
jgi:hypothetical protein